VRASGGVVQSNSRRNLGAWGNKCNGEARALLSQNKIGACLEDANLGEMCRLFRRRQNCFNPS